jgi:hypothetical protein
MLSGTAADEDSPVIHEKSSHARKTAALALSCDMPTLVN